MSTQKKALIVFSGGQDSTTCLFAALAAGYACHLLTFNYGQRHAVEIKASEDVARIAGEYGSVLSHEVCGLGDTVLQSTSPLVSNNVLEQYAGPDSLPGGVEKTFVPMRNQLFLTIAANRAVAYGCEAIYTGVCEEDSGGYPDCRASFITSIESAINMSNGESAGPIKIVTPLMHLDKAASVELALRMDGCYRALAHSHTAYDGQYPPLGHDHATLLREKGFRDAGIPDPLILRAVFEEKMAMPTGVNYEHDITAGYFITAGLVKRG